MPSEVTGEELSREVRQELRSLPRTLAEDVAKNLVMVARLLDEDPELAYRYARVALRLASRVAAVREAAGFAAYGVEKYAEALAEFRAARRMTGGTHLWPVMADCERGLGRPERALAMAGAPEVNRLDKAGQVEMRLVAAGARRDMGQAEAAVVTLKVPELASGSHQPWSARLRYAYADALLAVGREEEARNWFAKALEVDQTGATDASDRLAELDGLEFVDALDPEAEEERGEQSVERSARSAEQPRDDAPGAPDATDRSDGEAAPEAARVPPREGTDEKGEVTDEGEAVTEPASDPRAGSADRAATDPAPTQGVPDDAEPRSSTGPGEPVGEGPGEEGASASGEGPEPSGGPSDVGRVSGE